MGFAGEEEHEHSGGEGEEVAAAVEEFGVGVGAVGLGYVHVGGVAEADEFGAVGEVLHVNVFAVDLPFALAAGLGLVALDEGEDFVAADGVFADGQWGEVCVGEVVEGCGDGFAEGGVVCGVTEVGDYHGRNSKVVVWFIGARSKEKMCHLPGRAWARVL